MLRLFFALQPAPTQSAALAEQVESLVARLKAQRVPAENLHATLCFIGSVPEERLGELQAAAAGVWPRRATLRFDALEYWRKPGVLCATAGESVASAPARGLAERLAQATSAAGFTPDLKPFRAHVTLARKIPAARAAQCEWPRVLAPPLDVHCDRFVLMQSRRGEFGSIYSVVNSWALDIDECGDKSR
jgi:2'-5' RNA ligase